jgi:hypothetical protein
MKSTLPDNSAASRVRNPANGHFYQRIDDPMSWHEAETFCAELGGYLASVISEEENDFVFDHFARDHVCWLGASDELQEGNWQWVSGEPFEYSNWFKGEPSNKGGLEHFLAIGSHPGVRYDFRAQWNDHKAAGLVAETAIMCPVCEWDSSPPGTSETEP